MIARLQMSDMHLGDQCSVLSDPEAARRVVSSLAAISGGQIGKLILAGDAWEECVPENLDQLEDGVALSVARASSGFFVELFGKIEVGEVVVVPGNHDLSTWAWYAKHAGISPVTSCEGVPVDPESWPWQHLLRGCPRKLTFAYPLYWDKSAGDDYPMLAVTHGHLLDALVLGEDSEATYRTLEAIGCVRSKVPENVSIRKLAESTLAFCLALWKRYSARDYVYFNKIMRRHDHPQSCYWSDKIVETFAEMDPDMCDGDQSSSAPGHSARLPWFLETIICDPTLPTPVGSLRQGPVGPAFTKSSCLTFGHDHLAIRRQLMACGVPWVAVDSGGWTGEFDGHHPHTHVLVWKEVSDVVPTTFLIRYDAGGEKA